MRGDERYGSEIGRCTGTKAGLRHVRRPMLVCDHNYDKMGAPEFIGTSTRTARVGHGDRALVEETLTHYL